MHLWQLGSPLFHDRCYGYACMFRCLGYHACATGLFISLASRILWMGHPMSRSPPAKPRVTAETVTFWNHPQSEGFPGKGHCGDTNGRDQYSGLVLTNLAWI